MPLQWKLRILFLARGVGPGPLNRAVPMVATLSAKKKFSALLSGNIQDQQSKPLLLSRYSGAILRISCDPSACCHAK